MTRLDRDPDLERLGAALRAGAARDLARRTRATHQRQGARRGALAAILVLAAAAVAAFMLTRSSAGESASTKQTLRRAAAVLTPQASSTTILYVSATETLSPLAQKGRATTVAKLTEHAWIQQGPPGDERVVLQVPGGPVIEENGDGEIYNETDNAIYPAPQTPKGTPHYTLTPTGSGSYRLRITVSHGRVFTQTLAASTAKALRDGQDSVQWTVGWNPRTQTQTIQSLVLPSLKQLKQTQTQQPDPASTNFASQLHGLLNSGHARVTRTTTSDGQPAIEISSVDPQSGPRTNYYVNPETYAPIELDSFGYDSPRDITRIHLNAYETLPLAGHRQLLKVTIPATAHKDRTPAAYWNAEGLPRPF